MTEYFASPRPLICGVCTRGHEARAALYCAGCTRQMCADCATSRTLTGQSGRVLSVLVHDRCPACRAEKAG